MGGGVISGQNLNWLGQFLEKTLIFNSSLFSNLWDVTFLIINEILNMMAQIFVLRSSN